MIRSYILFLHVLSPSATAAPLSLDAAKLRLASANAVVPDAGRQVDLHESGRRR
jgi:hypothetical protein